MRRHSERDRASTRRIVLGRAALEAPAEAGGPRRIEGIAVPYGPTTRDEQGRLERFLPGAFAGEVRRWSAREDGARVPILNRHGGDVVAMVDELEDTPEGLRFRGSLLEGPAAESWARTIEAGANGVSVEFDATRSRRRSPNGIDHAEAVLFAIAGAHAPAYDGARVALRSRIGGQDTMRYSDRIRQRLEALRSERSQLASLASAEGRAMTDAELDESDALDTSIGNLERTLVAAEAEEARGATETAATSRAAGSSSTAASSGSTAARPSETYSPGAFLRDRFLSTQRGDRTAAQRLERALADVTTADAPGVIPSQITGPIIGGFATRRPLVESATPISIGEAGMSVIRPLLTGGDVNVQATEKTEVTSTAMTIDPVEFDLATYAGGVDVSWQLIERSSPSALDAIFRRLANRYARRTEIVAAAAFKAAVTDTQAISAWTAAGVIAALIAAISDIAVEDDIDQFPDTLWLSLDAWADFAGVLDGDGRPLFPLNGGGINLGLGGGDQVVIRPVIVPRFATKTAIIGASDYLERYELAGSPVQFRSIEAALLGTNVSVAGLFALGVTDADAFVEFTFPA